MATFGTWPASDARDWELVVVGIKTIDRINSCLKVVNYSLGWVQPISFFAYRAYASATDYYVKAMRAKVFAHQPGALIGCEVDVRVSLAGMRVERTPNGFLYTGRRKIDYFFQSKQTGQWVRARGVIQEAVSGRFILHDNSIGSVRE